MFYLESQRSSFKHRPTGTLPYVGKAELDNILQSFEHNVNFWYPTLSRNRSTEVEIQILSNSLDEGIPSCLALLVMALGCASKLIRSISSEAAANPDVLEKRHRWQLMSGLYFDLAFKKIYLAQAECTTEAVQCLFFTA